MLHNKGSYCKQPGPEGGCCCLGQTVNKDNTLMLKWPVAIVSPDIAEDWWSVVDVGLIQQLWELWELGTPLRVTRDFCLCPERGAKTNMAIG